METRSTESEQTFAQARITYGPITTGEVYRLIRKGKDYYKIRARGQIINAPQWIFSRIGNQSLFVLKYNT